MMLAKLIATLPTSRAPEATRIAAISACALRTRVLIMPRLFMNYGPRVSGRKAGAVSSTAAAARADQCLAAMARTLTSMSCTAGWFFVTSSATPLSSVFILARSSGGNV